MQQGLEFEEINVSKTPHLLDRENLVNILKLSDNGFKDILIPRKNIPEYFLLYFKNFEDLSFNQAIALFLKFPKVLHTPIIFDDKRVQVGFNKEDIRQFIPDSRRRIIKNF